MNSQAQSKVSQVLQASTILRVNKCPSINHRGMAILGRWAVNQPEELRELERNTAWLMIRLLEQQELEAEILDRPESLDQLAQGLTESEILTRREVNMGL
jgi:hypothetical protein